MGTLFISEHAQAQHRVGIEQDCFRLCQACKRCDQRGRYAKCNGCNGRIAVMRKPHPDDTCRCAEGILQIVTREGRKVQTRYANNPYGGDLTVVRETEDERDWRSYLNVQRELFDDPDWNPVRAWENPNDLA